MSLYVSLEPEARRDLLRETGAKYDLDVLVETGTNEGKTPLALKDAFREIYTVELDDQLYANAVAMFAPYPHVHPEHGDSAQILPLILRRLTGPALFWLDGHYSGPGTAHGADSSPIRDELRILFADHRPHVILVDDARIFGGGPEHMLYPHYLEYPTLDWVNDFAAQHSYDYELVDDIIRLTPWLT